MRSRALGPRNRALSSPCHTKTPRPESTLRPSTPPRIPALPPIPRQPNPTPRTPALPSASPTDTAAPCKQGAEPGQIHVRRTADPQQHRAEERAADVPLSTAPPADEHACPCDSPPCKPAGPKQPDHAESSHPRHSRTASKTHNHLPIQQRKASVASSESGSDRHKLSDTRGTYTTSPHSTHG